MIIFATYDFSPLERQIFNVSLSQQSTPRHSRTIHSTDCIRLSVIFIQVKLKLVSVLMSRFTQLRQHSHDFCQFIPMSQHRRYLRISMPETVSLNRIRHRSLTFLPGVSALLHFRQAYTSLDCILMRFIHSLHISAQVAIVTVLLLCIYYS